MPSSLTGTSDTSPPGAQRPLEPVLVVTSGAHRVDTAMAAQLLEGSRLHRVDADFVRQMSGFAIGGVAPVGWERDGEPWQPVTLVDVALAAQPHVWAAAIHPQHLRDVLCGPPAHHRRSTRRGRLNAEPHTPREPGAGRLAPAPASRPQGEREPVPAAQRLRD